MFFWRAFLHNALYRTTDDDDDRLFVLLVWNILRGIKVLCETRVMRRHRGARSATVYVVEVFGRSALDLNELHKKSLMNQIDVRVERERIPSLQRVELNYSSTTRQDTRLVVSV